MTAVEKVVAYITQGDRLLVFTHARHPEAGVQVPAGTMETGEAPEAAVLREAREETGLEALTVLAFLGTRDHLWQATGGAGAVRRHFFHLAFTGRAEERWRHFERHPSEGPTEPIEFELFWARLPDEVPPLKGRLGEMLPLVIRRLQGREQPPGPTQKESP